MASPERKGESMSKKKEEIAVGRRDFFRKAGLGAGAAGAAAVGLASGTAQAKTADASERKSGYRESEHVKTYYKLARF